MGRSHEAKCQELPPTIETRTKLDLLRYFEEQGSPISTTKLQNGVDTARHGLILRQHGATAYTKLLEAYLLEYRPISNRFFMKLIDFPGTRVGGVENPAKKHKILIVGWTKIALHWFQSSAQCRCTSTLQPSSSNMKASLGEPSSPRLSKENRQGHFYIKIRVNPDCRPLRPQITLKSNK